MKKKTLFEITIKIIGLIALWNFIQSLSAIMTAFGILSMFLSNGGIQNSFMAFVGFNIILSMVVPGIISYCCLYKTQNLLSFFKLENEEMINISLDEETTYHVLVLIFAGVILINGFNNFMVYNYNTETKNEFVSLPGTLNPSMENRTSSFHTESKKVNYFALAEIIIGVFSFLKAGDLTNWLVSRYGRENDDEEYDKAGEDPII